MSRHRDNSNGYKQFSSYEEIICNDGLQSCLAGSIFSSTAIMPDRRNRTMNDAQILAAISELQAIQKMHSPKSAEWRKAHNKLVPLFAEALRRNTQEWPA